MNLADMELACSKAGLKMTGQRKVVMKVLSDATDHPSVDDIYARAKAIDPSISMATTYRTMNTLEDLGIVAKREFNDGFARFETNTDHHHHLIDVETGDVVEFQNEELEAIKVRIAAELGYDLVDHDLELYGRKIKA